MLITHDEGGVRLLTLNRPDKLNAMTSALYRACADSLAEAAASEEIGAVVLTGAGRGFCAGNDLGELAGAGGGNGPADQGAAFAAFMDAISGFPKALLAAVNGVGVGIGMTLLPFCDAALIAASARLRGPFVSLGVAPEAGSSASFAAIMGWQRASHVLLRGGWVTAPEAVQLGLALEVVPDAEVVERTVEIADDIVRAGPLSSIVATKQLLVAARRELLSNARSREDATFRALFEAGVPGTPSRFAATEH
ncbi:MAG: enoyl-CoA hydratase/isomerase family protein [Acidimicrobiales bacterium]